MSISRSNLPAHIHRNMWVCVSLCVRQCVCARNLTKASQGRVHTVGSVCRCHHNHMSSLLKAIHQGQKLGDDTPFHLAMCLHRHAQRERETERESLFLIQKKNVWKNFESFFLSVVPFCTFSRLGAIASSSSMKMMAGALFSASSKAFLRLLSDSPASLLMISGPAQKSQNAGYFDFSPCLYLQRRQRYYYSARQIFGLLLTG